MTPKCGGILGWERLGTTLNPQVLGGNGGKKNMKMGKKNSIPVGFWKENGNFGDSCHLLSIIVFNGHKRGKNGGKTMEKTHKKEELDKENEEFWSIPYHQSQLLKMGFLPFF